MNEYDVVFLAFAGLVAWRVRGDSRALAWLAALAASYVVSAAYYRMGGPSHFVMSAMCDVAVIGLIYWKARYIWEMRLWRVFQVMFAINAAAFVFEAYPRLELMPPSLWHNVYAGSLDLANAVALAWIWFNGARGRSSDDTAQIPADRHPARYHLRRAVDFLHRERPSRPFWEVR